MDNKYIDLNNRYERLLNNYADVEKENNLLKEHIKDLETDINRLYYTMISLKAIDNEEKIEDIEEI